MGNLSQHHRLGTSNPRASRDCAAQCRPCADSHCGPETGTFRTHHDTWAHKPAASFPAVSDRRRKLGALGEAIAVSHLANRGFKILDRNFRTRSGELDIVAFTPGLIVFCEVKTRLATSSGRDPLESVHPRKRAQVRRLAASWLARRPGRPAARDLRFDAIGVTLDEHGKLISLDHLEGAF